MLNDFHQKNLSIVTINPMPFTLNINTRSFFMGSCFSINLSSKFEKLYLNTSVAPYGNIYNPVSLAHGIERIIDNKHINFDECFKQDGLYQHFDFYSKLGKSDSGTYIDSINNSITRAHGELLSSDLLIVTLGTAWVYEKESHIVNNCHRLPKKTFSRRILTIDEITENLVNALKRLKSLNSKIKIIITLSPVRHLRDSFEENTLSKALLRVAIEYILKEVEGTYFPSYEIVMDELRDYRWYKDDLAHPTEKAVDYITDRFIESAASSDFITYIKRARKLNSLLNHRIINNDSESSRKFNAKKEVAVNQFINDFPRLDNFNISKMLNNHLQKDFSC